MPNMEVIADLAEARKKRGKPEQFFECGEFIASALAEWFTDQYKVFVAQNHELYVYSNGVYKPDEALFSRECTVALGRHFKRVYLNEALAYLKNTAVTIGADEATSTGDLVNMTNGTLDLRDRSFHPHSPEHMSIIQLPTAFDSSAMCPAFDEFISLVLPPDCTGTVIDEILGHFILPTMQYETAVMFTGAGGNGKGTLISVIQHLLGEQNVSSVPVQELVSNRFASADLYGKLANLDADLPVTELVDSSTFKKLVSGDLLRAERKNKDAFHFRNRAKLLFSANALPPSRDNSHGFHRRWMIVPFHNKFDNKRLREALFSESEMSGIFNRALRGAVALMEQGKFSDAKTIDEMREVYRKESDTVLLFTDEKCEPCALDEGAVQKQLLYEEYQHFCRQWGKQPVGQTRFNARLRELYPFIKEDRNSSKRRWKGFRLIYHS